MMPKMYRNTNVRTADGKILGKTHAYHLRVNQPEPELGLYPSYLMVVNIHIGDDFYIPTVFIDEEHSTQDEIRLTITEQEIQKKQYTRLPVDDKYRHEELPLLEGRTLVDDISKEDQEKLSDVAPLPPGQQAD